MIDAILQPGRKLRSGRRLIKASHMGGHCWSSLSAAIATTGSSKFLGERWRTAAGLRHRTAWHGQDRRRVSHSELRASSYSVQTVLVQDLSLTGFAEAVGLMMCAASS